MKAVYLTSVSCRSFLRRTSSSSSRSFSSVAFAGEFAPLVRFAALYGIIIADIGGGGNTLAAVDLLNEVQDFHLVRSV